MARFTTENMNLAMEEYEYWVHRDKPVKKGARKENKKEEEEDEAGPSRVIELRH